MKVSMFILENDRLVKPHLFKDSYNESEIVEAVENSGFSEIYLLPVTTQADIEEMKIRESYEQELIFNRVKMLDDHFNALPEPERKFLKPIYDQAKDILSDPNKGMEDVLDLLVQATNMLDDLRNQKSENEETPAPLSNTEGEGTEKETGTPQAKTPKPKAEKKPKGEKKESSESIVNQ